MRRAVAGPNGPAAEPPRVGNMTKYETIEFERAGSVGWLRLDRPEKLNSFTVAMWHEMRALGEEVQDDPELRAVVVIGKGRAFSSGIDTTVFTAGSSDA